MWLHPSCLVQFSFQMNKRNKKVVPFQPPQHVLAHLCKMKLQLGHATFFWNCAGTAKL